MFKFLSGDEFLGVYASKFSLEILYIFIVEDVFTCKL